MGGLGNWSTDYTLEFNPESRCYGILRWLVSGAIAFPGDLQTDRPCPRGSCSASRSNHDYWLARSSRYAAPNKWAEAPLPLAGCNQRVPVSVRGQVPILVQKQGRSRPTHPIRFAAGPCKQGPTRANRMPGIVARHHVPLGGHRLVAAGGPLLRVGYGGQRNLLVAYAPRQSWARRGR